MKESGTEKTDSPNKKILIWDMELMRPGCVILQAVLGGTVSTQDLYGLGDWLVDITPNMQPYAITDEELVKLRGMLKPKREQDAKEKVVHREVSLKSDRSEDRQSQRK